MAPAQPSSLADAKKAILENGFFFDNDEQLGQHVEKILRDATPFASSGGLQFCKSAVLDNQHIWPVLESFFEWFALGLYRSIGPAEGDYTFSNGPTTKVTSLLVHLWGKGSKAIIWGGSHRYELPVVRGENNLWRVPRVSLKRIGLEPTEVTFEQGGFTIIDPRVAVKVEKGTAITFAFGTKEAIREWTAMKLRKSQDIERMVASMEAENFGMNVEYIE